MSRHELRNLLRRLLARMRYGLSGSKRVTPELPKRPTYLHYIED